jgi:hypothetical protein
MICFVAINAVQGLAALAAQVKESHWQNEERMSSEEVG